MDKLQTVVNVYHIPLYFSRANTCMKIYTNLTSNTYCPSRNSKLPPSVNAPPVLPTTQKGYTYNNNTQLLTLGAAFRKHRDYFLLVHT